MSWKEENVEFKGEKRYLSNMFQCAIKMDSSLASKYPYLVFDDKVYRSSEHLYQALKSESIAYRDKIRYTIAPHMTKKISKQLLTPSEITEYFEFRKDWDDIRVEVMQLCLELKFTQHPKLAQKLLDTGDELIEERNYWNDTFWGTCKGTGKNMLGQLLMAVRDQLKVSN
jgi:hypothetical protein